MQQANIYFSPTKGQVYSVYMAFQFEESKSSQMLFLSSINTILSEVELISILDKKKLLADNQRIREAAVVIFRRESK